MSEETRLGVGGIVLDTLCWKCNPYDCERNIDPNCGFCDGTGYELTPEGEALMEFIIRHLPSAKEPSEIEP